jgi:hypothetical protein
MKESHSSGYVVAKDTSRSRRVDYLGWYLSLRDCLCCPLLYSEEPFKAYGTRFLLSGTVEGRGPGSNARLFQNIVFLVKYG